MPDLDIIQYEVTGALGRHLVRDPRSLAYRRRYSGERILPTEWAPKIPVLDQRNLLAQGIRTSELIQRAADIEDVEGPEDAEVEESAEGPEPVEDVEGPEAMEDADALASCTGNAATALISILHTADDLADAGLDVTDPAAAETWAIGLYADATQHDQWLEYTWPNQDCGSSGLSVAKALRARGLIDQYGHATTAEELCRDLQNGPVLMGLPWHDAWFEPGGQSALLDDIPDWQESPIVGGHEVCITALEHVMYDTTSGLDYQRTILRARSSWSASWADAGEFRFSLAIYQALRDQIDITMPRLDNSR
ncbi:hypothetical protein ACFC08_28360 [Streptomyces sp. NPDC056112]|uniref:hypothetical protein n=1 Tax=Streptomyces sp. NPDC056112 TaxID=3345715 RepID=UPI0035DF0E35